MHLWVNPAVWPQSSKALKQKQGINNFKMFWFEIYLCNYSVDIQMFAYLLHV